MQQVGHARVLRQHRRVELANAEPARAIDEAIQQGRTDALALEIVGDGNREFAVIGLLLAAHEATDADRAPLQPFFQFRYSFYILLVVLVFALSSGVFARLFLDRFLQVMVELTSVK